MNVHVYWTKTGVKYLHHKTQESDLRVYCEANGHSTALCSKAAEVRTEQVAKTLEGGRGKAAQTLDDTTGVSPWAAAGSWLSVERLPARKALLGSITKPSP